MTGVIIGRVMFRNLLPAPAPSISADSYSSVGMPRRPARKTSANWPAPSWAIITSASFVYAGSPSQFGDGSPTDESTQLTSP